MTTETEASRSASIARTGQTVVLLGESMDMAHTLRAAGFRVVVVAGPHAPARHSRHAFEWHADPRPGDEALVRLLCDLAKDASLGLFYETDRDLLMVSRWRKQLSPRLKVVLPSEELVEQLVDKARFRLLAEQLDLPVPESAVVLTAGSLPELAMGFPVLVKPVVRDDQWGPASHGQKALVAKDPTALRLTLDALAPCYRAVLVQRYVPGPEHEVHSYHVYVDAQGVVAAEFTGRKVRTWPAENGYSTSVVTTDCEDVRDAGREVVAALGLVGVAKLDFKRGPDGRLWLLEVNPRFTLWHHLGAAAGVDIPAIVMADLVGRPRPPAATARPGVAWCQVPGDLIAAQREGLNLHAWLRWAKSCPARSGFDLRDPVPYLAGRVWPRATARWHSHSFRHKP